MNISDTFVMMSLMILHCDRL